MIEQSKHSTGQAALGHTRRVRISHWIVTASFLTLAFSGVVILMAHPRLYWGEVGNDLVPALFELPIGRNHQHGGWGTRNSFLDGDPSAVTASRTIRIFNENGWGRSLHFLAAWLLVLPGAFYLLAGIFSGHFRRRLLPRMTEMTPRLFWHDLKDHLRKQMRPTAPGSPYGLMQKFAYCGVIFFVLPLMVVTGLAMSPAITAAYPFLSAMFGGLQSARTVHFFAFVALLLFLFGHVAMVIRTGLKRQMRAMTLGE